MNLAAYTRYIPNARAQTYIAFAALVILFIAYVYFLCASVVHVVIRKEVMSELASVNSEVSRLEAEYIKRQHAVSDAVVEQKGFVAVAEKVFLERGDDTSVALVNIR